mmetsp:Transcript_4515/g.9874  ORF Transcript_4515/g.9874 Transcript_4515/m.9874 type:complete len:80 (+) Transcript_4515:28-267(+)
MHMCRHLTHRMMACASPTRARLMKACAYKERRAAQGSSASKCAHIAAILGAPDERTYLKSSALTQTCMKMSRKLTNHQA